MTIYLAAPLFSDMERDYIDNIVLDISRELHLDPLEDFYVPHRDNKYNLNSDYIYDENIKNLNDCDIMIAVLDGKDIDSGTAFEVGYFEAQEKPIFGILTDKRSYDENNDLNQKLNIMIYGSCSYGYDVFNNFDNLVEKLYDYLIEYYMHL